MEQQQDEATTIASKPHARMTPEQMATEQQKRGLRLSRQRVLQQLEAAQNPNHRRMLESALADLDSQLARLG